MVNISSSVCCVENQRCWRMKIFFAERSTERVSNCACDNASKALMCARFGKDDNYRTYRYHGSDLSY